MAILPTADETTSSVDKPHGLRENPAMSGLVLASASARRRDLLSGLGARFTVVPADVPEVPLAGERPEQTAQRLARAKAAAGAARCPGRWVLAADTVVAVELDGRGAAILGKPATRREAREMLRLLSGRTHRVCTGVVVLAPGGTALLDEVATTLVVFRPLADAEIDAYVESGEADDKAGAYAIQGGAAGFVVEVVGSYTNVVGLPVDLVEPALRRAGLLAGDAAAAP